MKVTIHHFSDVLCVWAYVAQVRVDELCRELGDKVELSYHFRPVFGDTARKLGKSWEARGGLAGYAAHVRGVATRFDHVTVGDAAWAEVAPRSSMAAHVFLSAVKLATTERARFEAVAWATREAFFAKGRDIGRRDVLLEVARGEGVDAAEIARLVDDGSAYAELNEDTRLADQYAVTVSPTLVFNEGRQRLVGNVGYRIIEANVHELLEAQNRAGDETQASWC